MKKEELISIIIPVYDTSEYLVRCFDSVLNQTYANIEIIIVDDGSTDSSKNIISLYEKKDNRVKAVYETHQGVSHARNVGLDLASGDYIGFVDSDDYIDPTMYETLLNLSKDYKAEVSMISFCKLKNNQILENYDSNDVYCLNKEELIKEYLILKKVKAHVTNKLFENKLFKEVRFPENTYYEDDAIFFQLVQGIKQCAIVEKSLYFYCIRNNNITKSVDLKPRQDFYDVTFANYNFIKSNYSDLIAYAAYYLIDSLVINYIYSINNNILDIAKQIEKDIPLMNELVHNYADVIIKELTPMKKCVLFALLWDLDFAKKYIFKYLPIL